MTSPARGVTVSADNSSDASDSEFERVLQGLTVDLLGYFSRRLVEPADAADAVTESLIVLWRRRSDVAAREEDLRRYAFGVVRKVVVRFDRGHARRLALATKLQEEVAGRSVPDQNVGLDLDLRTALRALPPKDRELVLLVAWEGFSVADASQLLGPTAVGGRARYSRARKRLRQSLSAANSLDTAVDGKRDGL